MALEAEAGTKAFNRGFANEPQQRRRERDVGMCECAGEQRPDNGNTVRTTYCPGACAGAALSLLRM